MLRPEHLRTLDEVVRLGSFAAAADRLGYTSSAVSQQMAALERECGVALFERSARSSVPTAAAYALAQRAPAVLHDLLAAKRAAIEAGLRTPRPVTLGLFPSLATAIAPELIAALDHEVCPGVQLIIDEPHRVVGELEPTGKADLALLYRVGEERLVWPTGLSRFDVGADPFRVVVPSTWKERIGHYEWGIPWHPGPLAEIGWILHLPGSNDHRLMNFFSTGWHDEPTVVAYCDDFRITLDLIGAGMGAALVPQLALTDDRPDLTVLDIKWLDVARTIFMLRRDDGHAPATDHVADLASRLIADRVSGRGSAVSRN